MCVHIVYTCIYLLVHVCILEQVSTIQTKNKKNSARSLIFLQYVILNRNDGLWSIKNLYLFKHDISMFLNKKIQYI